MKTRSLSLALAFCFSGAPALDAADITIDQLVDSVSGILGGSWSVAGNAAPGILNPQGAAPTGITGGGQLTPHQGPITPLLLATSSMGVADYSMTAPMACSILQL